MSFALIAKTLFSEKSVKNVPLDAAKARLLAEEMKIRTSALGIAQILTKSKTLDIFLNAKLDKLRKETSKKEAKESAELEKKKRSTEYEFKAYTLRTMMAMRRKIDLLTTITEKNNRIVENLANDLGKFKRGSKTNLKNPTLVRFNANKKTVKGRIDLINEDIEKIKSIAYRRRKSTGVGVPKPKIQPTAPAAAGGFGGLGLMGALGLGGLGAGLGMVKGLVKGGSILGLPFAINNTLKMFNGEKLSENPIDDYVARKTTPYAMGLGTYSAVRVGQGIYNKYKTPKIDPVEKRLTETMKKSQSLYDKKMAQISEERAKLEQKNLKNKRGKGARSYKKAQSNIEAMSKKREADAAKRLAKRVGSSAGRLASYGKQMTKWKAISSKLMGLGKRFPALGLAYLAFKVSQMSTYVADYEQKRISFDEYKKNMIDAYGDIASTAGSAAVGALLGGLAGSVFPGLGTLGGALVGGGAGLVADWFMDKSATSHWLGVKLFETLNEDKSAGKPQTTSAAAPTAAATASTSTPPKPQSAQNDSTQQTSPQSVASMQTQVGSATTKGGPSIIKDSAGKIVEIREGGNINWRNNNPGNIRVGDYATRHGAIGENGGFAIFPTMEIGRQAADNLLKTESYKNLTVAAAIQRWAPRADNNDPVAYAASIAKMTGMDVNQRYVDLSAADKGKVLDAMNRVEGGKIGTVRKPTAEESSSGNVAVAQQAPAKPTNQTTVAALAPLTEAQMQGVRENLDKGVRVKPDIFARYMAQRKKNNEVVDEAPSAKSTSGEDSAKSDEQNGNIQHAQVAATAALSTAAQLSTGFNVMSKQLDDVSKTVAGQIEFPNVINKENSFAAFANRRV